MRSWADEEGRETTKGRKEEKSSSHSSSSFPAPSSLPRSLPTCSVLITLLTWHPLPSPCVASNPSNPLHSPIANDFPIIPQRFPKDGSSTDDKQLAKQILSAQVGLSEQEISRMHKFVLGRKKVSNMTKGGRT